MVAKRSLYQSEPTDHWAWECCSKFLPPIQMTSELTGTVITEFGSLPTFCLQIENEINDRSILIYRVYIL